MSDKVSVNEILAALPLAAAYQLNHGETGGSNGLSLKVARFQKQYQYDPVGFVHDCFFWNGDEGPTFYQDEILSELTSGKRICVVGPRGLGKSTLLSWATLWFALTRMGSDWKAGTTAGVWRQLEDSLWPEIHKWAHRLRWDLIGRGEFNEKDELLALRLKLEGGHAFAAASNKPSAMESTHADHLMYSFDEAKLIQPGTFDSLEGSFSNAGPETGREAIVLVFSTPGEPAGRLYDIQTHKPGFEEDVWWTKHVTIDDVLKAGQLSATWVENMRKAHGVGSTFFRQQVLGEFASDDEDAVIPLSWIEASNERWYEWIKDGRPGDYEGLGVDVGRHGDRTVIAPMFGDAIGELKYLPKTDDTMEATATVIRTDDMYSVEGTGNQVLVVDMNGIGAGMYDRLRELGRPVRAFNASTRATSRDETGSMGFVNKRAESWWTLRQLLDPKSKPTLALPPDDLLTGDLVTPKYRTITGVVGKIQIEGKADIKKRIGRSTDSADAVIMIVTDRLCGFSKYLEILGDGIYDCPSCGNPVLDLGDSVITCQRCGKIIDRVVGSNSTDLEEIEYEEDLEWNQELVE